MIRKVSLLSLLGLLSLFAQAQIPSDNPYRTFYSQRLGQYTHWTDSLAWNKTVVATQIPGLINSQFDIDSTRWIQVLDSLSATGGACIYFPAGTYYFGFSFQMRSGIVCRGTIPIQSDARDSSFAPPTRWEFPAYIPSFTGNGTPNQTSFKSISNVANCNHIGLVYLDIKRAGINFSSRTFRSVTTSKGNTTWNAEKNRNFLVFGVRSNLVAQPEPQVPSAGQFAWQRYCSRHTYNIIVNAFENASVSNCRLNDLEANKIYPIADESYDQPGYLYEDNSTMVAVADGAHARFNYLDHYGIRVGRRTPPWDHAEPEDFPDNFRKGNEIRNNWVCKTMRVGITGAGDGLVIADNVLVDKPGKIAYLHPIGNKEVNPANTYENRGIDWSGWNVQVRDNNVQVFKHKFYNSNYESVDGEGILIQDCCGGTSVNGITIANNQLRGSNPYIGIYKMRDVWNVRIESNDLGTASLEILANTNDDPYKLFSTYVLNNYNIGKLSATTGTAIRLTGSLGGNQNLIDGNKINGNGRLGNRIEATCQVQIGTNNQVGNRFIPVDSVRINNKPCNVQQLPIIQISSPSDSSVYTSPSTNPIKISTNLIQGFGIVDSIVLYNGIQAIASAIPLGNSTDFDFTLPTHNSYSNLYAKAFYQNGKEAFSNFVRVYTRFLVLNLPDEIANKSNSDITIYPNPFQDIIQIQYQNLLETVFNWELCNGLGQKVLTGSLENENAIFLENIPKGIYTLCIFNTKGARHRFKIIKQ